MAQLVPFNPNNPIGRGSGVVDNGNPECYICFELPKDPVVGYCGHLFCWPCLYQWLRMKPWGQTCPVCKSQISRDTVVPIYGSGSQNEDPRDKTPPPRRSIARRNKQVNVMPLHLQIEIIIFLICHSNHIPRPLRRNQTLKRLVVGTCCWVLFLIGLVVLLAE